MNLVSYAQNLEDIMLWRALESVGEGFYIDVGANDPETDSVTKLFYDRGWHGINIEPLQQHLLKLRTDRPRDINLGCGAGAAPSQLQIWESDVRGWATMDADVAARHETDGHEGQWHTVEVRTLADICAEHAPANIHFLKVDVEGFEREVLLGMDFAQFRPWIVVVEATLPNSKIENYTQWEALLLQAGYLHAYSDGLNRFYVAREHKDLLDVLKYPPNVFDAYNTAKTQALHDWALDNEARVKVLQQQVEQMTTQAATLTEQLATQAKVLNEQMAQCDAKVDALANDLAEREARLADMFHSTSWKVTAPLRWLGIQRTRLQEQGLKNRVRRCAVQASRMGIRFVRARPGLRSTLARIAHKTGLYGPLFRLYSRISQATAVEPSSRFATPPADALLTPRGQRVYNDLLETLRKENH